MLQLCNYSLQVGSKKLMSRVNIMFNDHIISHILGCNGVGKSCFAKSCVGILDYHGDIKVSSKPILIGSYSNVPLDLRMRDLLKILKSKFSADNVDKLVKLLNLDDLPSNQKFKKMSDGQKQKVKLLAFLSSRPEVIILDEFTNALDKKSTIDIYNFMNAYVIEENITCLNITHNLSDLEYMPGKYYWFADNKIIEVPDKQNIIDKYIKGR